MIAARTELWVVMQRVLASPDDVCVQTLISVSPVGVNVSPQGLNIAPALIAVSPGRVSINPQGGNIGGSLISMSAAPSP